MEPQHLNYNSPLLFALITIILACLAGLVYWVMANFKVSPEPMEYERDTLTEGERYLLRQCVVGEYSRAHENEKLTFDPTLKQSYLERKMAISKLYRKLAGEEIKAQEEQRRPQILEDRCAADSHMWIGSN